jgi:hypothetical protein
MTQIVVVYEVVYSSFSSSGGSCRWTRRSHPYRRSLEFNGKQEFQPPPIRMTTEETMQSWEAREACIGSGGRKNHRDDPIHSHGVKRRNILFELEYWQVWFLNSSPSLTVFMCMPALLKSGFSFIRLNMRRTSDAFDRNKYLQGWQECRYTLIWQPPCVFTHVDWGWQVLASELLQQYMWCVIMSVAWMVMVVQCLNELSPKRRTSRGCSRHKCIPCFL